MKNQKSIVLKLTQFSQFSLYYEFIKLCIIQRKKFIDEIFIWLETYLKTNSVKETLVFEKDLIKILKKSNLKYTKMTLYQFRQQNIFVDDLGKPLWETDGFYVVYKLEPVLQIIQDRKNKYGKRVTKSR